MTALTHWFACGCGRNFVEHRPKGLAADGQCPDCGAKAERYTISETAARIVAVAKNGKGKTAAKRRA